MASRILQKGKHRITQGFGAGHKAVDLGREHLTGEPIIAHTAGKVVFCQTGQKNQKGAKGNASYGNCVKLDHGHGYSTLYAHLATVTVKNGEKVKKGQVLGTMGNTGNSFGMHLHFEVRKDNKHLDPTPYLAADLPLPKGETPRVNYKVYANGWLPEVTDAADFAGVHGKKATAILANPTHGTLTYRVHLLGKGWLPWVKNDTDFAGVRGKAIDALQMKFEGVEGYDIRYRVSPAHNQGWYGWCVGLTDATGDGYAGVLGKPIDCVQMELVKKG